MLWAGIWGGFLVLPHQEGFHERPVLWLGSLVTLGAIFLVLAVVKYRQPRHRRYLAALLVSTSCFGMVLAGWQMQFRDSHPARATLAYEQTVTADVLLTHPVIKREYASQFGSYIRWSTRGSLQKWSKSAGVQQAPVLVESTVPLPDSGPGVLLQLSAVAQPLPLGSEDILRLRTHSPPTVLNAGSWFNQQVLQLRNGLQQASQQGIGTGADLLPGLVLGDVSEVRADLSEDMRRSGLAHVTAVSGANVAYVSALVFLLGRLLRFPARLNVLLAGLAIVGFIVLVGPDATVLRAGVMGFISVFALIMGGTRQGMPALAGATVLLLLWHPWFAVDYGFAMSVLATGAIVFSSRRIQQWLGPMFGVASVSPPHIRGSLLKRLVQPTHGWAWVRYRIRDVLALTLAAQLAVTPLLVSLGAGISLVSIPANILAEPAVAPATILGLLATLVSPLSAQLAAAIAWPATLAASWIVLVAQTSSAMPAAVIPWPEGPGGALLLSALLALLLLFRPVVRQRLLRKVSGLMRWDVAVIFGILTLGGIWFVFIPPVSQAPQSTDWLVYQCDVGQGDALLLRAGPSSAVVVDVGEEPDLIDRCLTQAQVTHIPLLILSHFHADHVAGVMGIGKRPVSRLWVSPLPEVASAVQHVQLWAGEKRVQPQVPPVGPEVEVGQGQWRVQLRVLRPNHPVAGSPNDSSLVVLATVNGVRVLATGDIEQMSQQLLQVTYPDLGGVDVLKVPHHGSNNRDAGLLAWAQPRLALISVGAENTHGHPHPKLIADLEQLGVVVARTDISGSVWLSPGPQTLDCDQPQPRPMMRPACLQQHHEKRTQDQSTPSR